MLCPYPRPSGWVEYGPNINAVQVKLDFCRMLYLHAAKPRADLVVGVRAQVHNLLAPRVQTRAVAPTVAHKEISEVVAKAIEARVYLGGVPSDVVLWIVPNWVVKQIVCCETGISLVEIAIVNKLSCGIAYFTPNPTWVGSGNGLPGSAIAPCVGWKTSWASNRNWLSSTDRGIVTDINGALAVHSKCLANGS